MSLSSREAIAITGTRPWTGGPAPLAGPVSLRLEGGRIAALGRDPALTAGARVLHFENMFSIPGLIDSHVHMALDPSKGVAAQNQISARERHQAMRERAKTMVRCGITTARDLGGADWEALELRDQIAAGEAVAPALRASAEEVADAARGQAETAMKEVAATQEAEAKAVLRRAAAEADAPAEKAIEVLAAKTKAVEPARPRAAARAKPPPRIDDDDDDDVPSRRRRCDWKGMDIKFDRLLDQLEDACQISKHALAILPSEKEKKEIDAELVRRSYDEMLDRVRLAHDRATDILKAAGPPKPKPPPPPPPPPYIPGAPFVPFCGEGNVLGGEW